MAISLISTLSRTFRRHPNTLTPPVDHRRQIFGVPARTGPLTIIRNRKTLVIADAQNLEYSARDLGFKISWDNLGKTLDKACSRCSRHVIFSKNAGQSQRLTHYTERGWQPHARLTKTEWTRNGLVRKSNADFLLAVVAGRLSDAKWDILIICSGDGDLVEDVASGIRGFGSINTVVTLSLAGSTAWRLNSQYSPVIAANIQVGLDCLRPISAMRNDHSNYMPIGRWGR